MPLTDSFLLDPLAPPRVDIWVALRTDGVKGSGTEDDPYDGSTADRFDAVMTAVPASPPTTVRLGPGVFPTRGYKVDAGTGWVPRSGGRIAGSGMAVTTLKLVEADSAGWHYVAIGSDAFLDGLEVCDLTIDCNMAGQPVPMGQTYAPVACGAIGLRGTRLKIRRVRAINFGTGANRECFVIFVGRAGPTLPEVVDCMIEDCVVEQPSLRVVNLVSCIGVHSGQGTSPYQAVPVFHRGCAIRNCVVDCYYRANPVRIASITFSGMVATVTTPVPHGRSAGNWVRISGAYVNGSILNPYIGSFVIANATPTTFQYTMPATPAAAPTGELWLDRFPSRAVSIASVVQIDAVNRIYEITTRTPTTGYPTIR